jgi:hypothetical protein
MIFLIEFHLTDRFQTKLGQKLLSMAYLNKKKSNLKREIYFFVFYRHRSRIDHNDYFW